QHNQQAELAAQQLQYALQVDPNHAHARELLAEMTQGGGGDSGIRTVGHQEPAPQPAAVAPAAPGTQLPPIQFGDSGAANPAAPAGGVGRGAAGEGSVGGFASRPRPRRLDRGFTTVALRAEGLGARRATVVRPRSSLRGRGPGPATTTRFGNKSPPATLISTP